MNAREISAAPVASGAAHTAGSGPRAGEPFARALERAVGAFERRSAPPLPLSGELGATGALALQAELYRHAARLELASKLLDHGVGAVKTLLQTRL